MHIKKYRIFKAKEILFYCIKAPYGENMVLQEHMEQYECCIFRNIIISRYCLNSFVLKKRTNGALGTRGTIGFFDIFLFILF